jgi:4-hydroxybenzoate polyprenyltransferase
VTPPEAEEEPLDRATRRGFLAGLRALLGALRPKQWTKNLLLFSGFLFTLNQRWRPMQPEMWSYLRLASLGALMFCAISSGVYLLNDLRDLPHDRVHPVKRRRPIARGLVPPWLALLASVVLLGGGLAGAFFLRPLFGWVGVAYVLMQAAYTLRLKHVVILDVFIIAAGFVLRAISGAIVISVEISPWLYIVTFLGALFLGLCKRRHELSVLAGDAGRHRRILEEYSIELLDQMIGIVTASTIMAYSLYTFWSLSAQTRAGSSGHLMMATIPHVLYGMFRYLYLVHRRGGGGSPEETLLRDRPLLCAVVLWIATAAAILLLGREPST